MQQEGRLVCHENSLHRKRTLLKPSLHTQSEDPIRCASISGPTANQQHRRDLLRFVMVSVALLATLLLLAGAFDYTTRKTTAFRHVRLAAPFVPLLRVG
jgi:hypothetical protein